MERCWILLGMMGAGKSSVGRELAVLSGREFLDTDLMLQHKLGRPVSQLFHVYGEDAFREHETALLKSLDPCHCVLSTGGGIVLREANWHELRRLGTTIYLKADVATLVERLARSKKKRPLLQVDEWEGRVDELLTKRSELYERADLTVPLDDADVAGGAKRIFELLRDRQCV